MSRKGFASGTLIKMKGKLDVSSIPTEVNASLDGTMIGYAPPRSAPVLVSAPSIAPQAVAPAGKGPILVPLMAERRGETEHLRVELAGRIARYCSRLEHEEIEFQRQSENRKDVIGGLRRLDLELKGNQMSSIREIERIRMEFFRLEGKFPPASNSVDKSPSRGAISEMAELTRSDIVRFAMLWSLPIILAIIFCAGAVALAIIWSLKP